MVKFSGISKRQRAQKLAYDAMDCIYEDPEKAVELCTKALKIYPDCVDAQGMLAEIRFQGLTDYIAAMEKAVASGRRDLGKKCFEEDKGYFWGLLETRPFMRAMMQLADGYRQTGKQGCGRAMEIFEEMLELNPNDNQGVRYKLVDCYLAQKLYPKAGQLLKKYPNESMAVFNWARVLYAYVTQGEKAAEKAIQRATQQNPFVLAYLSGKKRLPRTQPDYYSPGDKSEAIFCVDTIKESWKNHPEVKQWLAQRRESEV